WGTTCPEDPSWRAGEGANSQWRTTASHRRGAEAPDTIDVPLYPRHDVQPLCREAVSGRIFLPDTITWRRVHGQVTILMDSLEMGSTMRDRFAYSSVFETTRYPSVRYTIDSVVNLIRQGDTLVGMAAGVVSVRGVGRARTAAR